MTRVCGVRADLQNRIEVRMGTLELGSCLETGVAVIVRFVGFTAVRFASLPRNGSTRLAMMHQLGRREGMWAIEEQSEVLAVSDFDIIRKDLWFESLALLLGLVGILPLSWSKMYPHLQTHYRLLEMSCQCHSMEHVFTSFSMDLKIALLAYELNAILALEKLVYSEMLKLHF